MDTYEWYARLYPKLGDADLAAYAREGVLRVCEHAPWQTYTKYPCECGRPLWPPRGRGRGESLTSSRRGAAFAKAVHAHELRTTQDLTWREIAKRLDYGSAASAWKAVRRMLDKHGQKQRPMPRRVGPIARGLARDLAHIDAMERRSLR